VLLFVLAAGCREQTMAKVMDQGASECTGTAQTTCSNACPIATCPPQAPTYADVQPILETHCVTCHVAGGQEPQIPLDTYDGVKARASDVLFSIAQCVMPKPDDTVDQLSPDDRTTLEAWLVCGALNGLDQ
jgi:uncharacterized membrane protein